PCLASQRNRGASTAMRLYADHADVPRSRVGLPVGGDARRCQTGLPRTLPSCAATQVNQDRRRHLYAWRADDLTATQAKVDLAGLKMLVGASALPKALAKRAMGLGVDVFAGYGMSETGPLLTVAHLKSSDLAGDPDQQVEIRTRAGRTCPLVDLQIVDPDMKRLPHDGESSGEIIVRAPWLTNGYFDNPDASEQLWAGGYLHTDDIGGITPDGYLQIIDRIKDVIKSGGEWISSLQLEDIIMQCAGVAECAIIGIKDARWGERPLALVVRDPKTEPPVRVQDIKAHVMAQNDKGVISKYAMPHKIVFVDALAKTSVGKLDKKALRAQYGDAASDSPRAH